MTGHDDYKTEKLLDYLYHQNYCKCTGIDLKKNKYNHSSTN